MKARLARDDRGWVTQEQLRGVRQEDARWVCLAAGDVEPCLPCDADVLLDTADALLREGEAYISEYEGILRIAYCARHESGDVELAPAVQPGDLLLVPNNRVHLLRVIGRVFGIVWVPSW